MSSLQNKLAIAKFLENVVVPDEMNDGWMRYVDGCSDSYVAKQLGTTKQLVVSVRKALYGSNFLVPQRQRKSDGRIAALEERITALERKVEELMSKEAKPQWIGSVGLGPFPPPPQVPRWDRE